MKKFFFSLGLMSGTSMDGIDISIIKSDGEQFIEIIDDMYFKYHSKLKSKLKKMVYLCTSRKELHKLSEKIDELEREITLSHAEASNLIIRKNKNIKIDLIGFHGQTILHKPQKGMTVQIGDSKLLSRLTNTMVISDFRKNDVLNGGQGAPLSPIYHKLILTKIKTPLPSAIVNIGGISNVTYLNKNNKIIGFDTGPGNCLIDKWISMNSKMDFDNKGLIAESGKVDEKILENFLKSSYFKKKCPKTLDIKDFNLKKFKNINLKDGSATLSMITINSICMAINSFKNSPKIVLISGGGRKNKFIVKNIKKNLNCLTFLIDKYNFNGDFIESQTFAYLAIRSYLKKYLTLPSTTGVNKACLGGILYNS